MGNPLQRWAPPPKSHGQIPASEIADPMSEIRMNESWFSLISTMTLKPYRSFRFLSLNTLAINTFCLSNPLTTLTLLST